MDTTITSNRSVEEKVDEANDFRIRIDLNVSFPYGSVKDEAGLRRELVNLVSDELNAATREIRDRFHELFPGKPVHTWKTGDI